MLKKIAVVVIAIVAAFAAFVATRPSEYQITRSRTLQAPPDVVHTYVNDFHHWPEWSPWEKLDPGMKRDISGPPSGPGAAYSWSGNDEVGEGRMTITDSQPPRSLTIRLEFVKPFADTSTTQFDFAPSAGGTNITWSMKGHHNFVSKAVCLFMDMDKMVGGQFEKGLADLDSATAKAAAARVSSSQ
jgi:hypothetical protein